MKRLTIGQWLDCHLKDFERTHLIGHPFDRLQLSIEDFSSLSMLEKAVAYYKEFTDECIKRDLTEKYKPVVEIYLETTEYLETWSDNNLCFMSHKNLEIEHIDINLTLRSYFERPEKYKPSQKIESYRKDLIADVLLDTLKEHTKCSYSCTKNFLYDSELYYRHIVLEYYPDKLIGR